MPVKLNIGRQRVTRVTSPSEAGYVRHIRRQVKQLNDNLNKIIEHIRVTSPAALEHALKPIFDESQRLVPKDTRALQSSGFLEVVRKGTAIQAAMGYGKGGTPHYTIYVHERLDLKHSGGTQAKFLEEPVQRQQRLIPARYANYVRRQTGIK